MTPPDDDTADRGARFLGKLLARDAKELDVADDAEVERQMDAAGVKVGAVPGLDELLARAEAKAAGASDVRTKQAAASGPNVQAVANGPPSSPKVAAMRSSGPRTTMPPPRARWTAVNVAAATAVAAVAIGVIVTNRRGLFGPGEGEGIRPDDVSQGRTSAGPSTTGTASAGPSATAPATPEETAARARELRAQAAAACDAKKWHACGAALDDARDLDPAGEDTPEVIKLRHQVFEGITSKGEPIK
ncbi:MAG TPA: hypothetical protein VGG39_02735 [Polyangiaceae bacterium]